MAVLSYKILFHCRTLHALVTKLNHKLWFFFILKRQLQFEHTTSQCFLFSQNKTYNSDFAKIYSVHITNVVGGVASQCRRCALTSVGTDSACVLCPPGHFMVSETGACKSCPPNSITKASQPVGEEACVRCGPNTRRNKVREQYLLRKSR